MTNFYNGIAGQSCERLAALSDCIFGVGMTLLVLDLRLPAIALVHSEQDLKQALLAILPQLLMYLMSFMTLGILWVGQQTQINHLERTDRHLTWIYLGFLFGVTLMPFSTKLLAEFSSSRTALVVYWGNILLPGIFVYVSWGYATRHRLLQADVGPEVAKAICRRIQIAQALYAFGALLCLISTTWSIAFIVLVQLNYVIAPSFRGRTAEGLALVEGEYAGLGPRPLAQVDQKSDRTTLRESRPPLGQVAAHVGTRGSVD